MERRHHSRLPIRTPVRVRGREAGADAWEEVTTSLDASSGGIAVVLERTVRTGQVIHLSLPLPATFRQYDLVEPSYRVYGLVRHRDIDGDRSRVGIVFIGPTPPRGSNTLPTERFLLPGDSDAEPRLPLSFVLLRLESSDSPGGLPHQERAAVERLAATSAVVNVRHLPVSRGTLLTLQSEDGRLTRRVEVTGIAIDGGRARLILQVLGARIPAQLVTDLEPAES